MIENDSNPYVAPIHSAFKPLSRFRSRLISWILFLAGFVVLFFSKFDCWFGLRLMNQEYWHLWRDTSTIGDVEILGNPVSLDEAIRHSLGTVLVVWLIAGFFFAASRYIHPPKAIKTNV